MNAALLEQRAMRLVDRLRERGVLIWPRADGGAIFVTPLTTVSSTERAFIAANPEAVTVALEPDADERRALDRCGGTAGGACRAAASALTAAHRIGARGSLAFSHLRI